MSEYKQIFDNNIRRVKLLVDLYSKVKDIKLPINGDNKATDILRASIVFLHSSFEEYFRSILISFLPERADDMTLKDIPISIQECTGNRKAEKIFLNDLAHYREKTINEVIVTSIERKMQETSFNSQAEIRKWCDKVKISVNEIECFDDIEKAVSRRHKIVHEADFDKANNRVHPVKEDDVNKWIKSYIELVEHIESQI